MSVNKYVAFLRGINVGGHHKVAMSELKKIFEQNDFKEVVTLLNTGNIIFTCEKKSLGALEQDIRVMLEQYFSFPIPVFVLTAHALEKLIVSAPFKHVKITPDIRLYVSFIKNTPVDELQLPWTSPDESYTIVQRIDNIVLSYLNLSINNTPKAMEAFNKHYGKDNTTRNWKTIERILQKIQKQASL